MLFDVAPEERFLSPSLTTTEGARRAARSSLRAAYLVIKCWLDFLLAALLLVLTGPVILVCAVLVRLTSRGPAFYSQVRLGLGGRPYRIYKLRTMVHDSEASGPQWSRRGDPRVTRLGLLLRHTHLDELPQLWNILRGEMSLIGPRPERPEFIPALAEAVPLYANRLEVRPGVTGLAQVQLPADTDMSSVRAKIAYDLYYIDQSGLWLDLRIVAATGFKVLGASFGFLRRVFRLPATVVVEQHYRGRQRLSAAARPRSEQPAGLTEVGAPELVPTS